MDVLEAVAEPTRRRIVEMLAVSPLSAGEIAAAFTISRPGVSQHIRVLREVGVVDVEQRGTRRVYRLRVTALDEVADWLEAQRRRWNGVLDALEKNLEGEPDG